MRSRARRARAHDFVVGTVTGVVALAALVVGSEYGKFHGAALHPKVVAWTAAAVLCVFGVVSTRRISSGLGTLATQRSFEAAGAAVRLICTGAGLVVVAFAVFGVLGVSIGHLLIGAGLAGVVLGIAAQQSLGNVFASVVLLFARPFRVGDRIRIRSGVVGTIDVQVIGIGLTYVTVRTDDGELKVPNSVMLASGIGKPTPPQTPPSPPGTTAAG